MATHLVFGATGAVGRFLLRRLLAQGDRVVAISRRPPQPSTDGLQWLAADLFGATPDLPPVDSLLSVGPLDGCAHWLSKLRADGIVRIIAIGSQSAVSKRESADPRERDLAARLERAEERVVESAHRLGAVATILRPTLIYGAGLDHSLTPLAHFARRWRLFPLPVGGAGMRQPVHADDVAAGCVAVLGSPATAGKTYAIGGGERLSVTSMLDRMRASLGIPTLPLPLPVHALTPLVALAGRLRFPVPVAAWHRLATDLLADHADATRDFGWNPRPFEPDPECWSPAPLPQAQHASSLPSRGRSA